MLKLIVSILALATSVGAIADLRETDPLAVCSVLADIGLKGRKWVDYGDGTSGCASDYKEIGKASIGLANNLAFYGMGKGRTADEVKLVLNYNQPKQAPTATKELQRAAERLATKMLGTSLSPATENAITTGKPHVEKTGSGEIELTRDEWVNGNGYEVHVIYR